MQLENSCYGFINWGKFSLCVCERMTAELVGMCIFLMRPDDTQVVKLPVINARQ